MENNIFNEYSCKKVINEIFMERRSQHEKWGEQNKDFGDFLAILGEEIGEACKAHLKSRYEVPVGLENDKWRANKREELIQAGAVIVQWIECIDRHSNDPNYH